MLVSRHADVIEFARAFRNYGKPEYEVPGLNFRLNEFTAALGMVGVERLDEIVAWKNEVARRELDPLPPARLRAARTAWSRASTSTSCFEPIERSTGKVYDEPCHRLLGDAVDLPNTDWVAREPLVRAALLPAGVATSTALQGRAHEGPRHRRLRLHRLARRRCAARRRATSRVIFDLVRLAPSRAGDVETVIGDILDARPCAARCAAATRSCTWRRWRTSTTSSPTPRAPTASTRAARRGARGGARRRACRACIYAQHDLGLRRRSTAAEALDEDTAARRCPAHFYTATKLAGEMYCRSYAELYGARADDPALRHPVRPALASGRGGRRVRRARSRGKALTITGDGTQARQFVYVEDLADGVVAALAPVRRRPHLQPGRPARASACARSRDAVREVVRRRADRPRRRAAGRPQRRADLGRARRRELGWEPKVAFVEGVRRYVDWLADDERLAEPRRRARGSTGTPPTVLSQEAGEL